jgi:hypothetical protein
MHKLLLYFISIFLVSSAFVTRSSQIRVASGNPPFVDYVKGEKLTYVASYGIMNVIECSFEVSKNFYKVNGRVCNRVDVRGKSMGLLNGTFAIDNHWRSYIDREMKYSQRFYRNISEGRYKREEFTNFDQATNSLVVTIDNKRALKYTLAKGNIHDVISAYFQLRTLDFHKYKAGDQISTYIFLDDKAYNFKLAYVGKEVVKTKFGYVKAIKLQPVMPPSKALNGSNPVTIWISDDINKVPLRAEANLVVGNAVLNLETMDGLKAPLKIIKRKEAKNKDKEADHTAKM